MSSYTELAPAVDPYGLLRCGWTRTTGSGTPESLRVVPDACLDVIWHRESGDLFVAGPDTVGYEAPSNPGTLVGLRFSPGAAPAALGVPSDELRDGRVPLDELWTPAEVRRLSGELSVADNDIAAQQVLAEVVSGRAEGRRDVVATAVLTQLRAGLRVAEIAESVGLSERQLHRRCLTAFGYGAKVLHRVLRFDRAVRLARTGMPFADVAYRVGYADQAHLSREVKSLATVSLSSLL